VLKLGNNGDLVDVWPKEPWTADTPMDNGGGRGNYTYTLTSTGFTLEGFGKDGASVIMVP
jgi:hypothetical protein